MLKDVIDKWELRKEYLRKRIESTMLEDFSYKLLVELIAEEIIGIENDGLHLTEIDTDQYQGVNFYVFYESYGPYPDDLYTAYVWYGSCTGCDTLMGITMCDDGEPSEKQTLEFMQLCLNIVQTIKRPYDRDAIEMESND